MKKREYISGKVEEEKIRVIVGAKLFSREVVQNFIEKMENIIACRDDNDGFNHVEKDDKELARLGSELH